MPDSTEVENAKVAVESYWSKAWVWVANHPKTTIALAAAAIAVALVV